MNKKIIVILCIVVVLIVGLTGMSNSGMDKTVISQTIFVDAVYKPENNVVSITYTDNSKMTKLVTLEILGMEKTFHKEFEITNSSFSQSVSLDNVPKYGWKTTPVTLEITYDEFNIIKMKTEIHDENQPSPMIIFGSDN